MSDLKPCEAIEILESIYPSKKQIVTGEYPEVAEALDMAIAALRRAQSVNKPLTLEQLREMDGEPVWIDGAYPNGWRICCGKRDRKRHGRNVINFGNGVLQFESNYGKEWIAYAHKPEGSENE